jgi:hypothetical protein
MAGPPPFAGSTPPGASAPAAPAPQALPECSKPKPIRPLPVPPSPQEDIIVASVDLLQERLSALTARRAAALQLLQASAPGDLPLQGDLLAELADLQRLHNLAITVFLLSCYGALLSARQLAALWAAAHPWAVPVFAVAAAVKQDRARRAVTAAAGADADADAEGQAQAPTAAAPGRRQAPG